MKAQSVQCPTCKGDGSVNVDFDDIVGHAGSYTDTCERCEGTGELPHNYKELEAEMDRKAVEFAEQFLGEEWMPGLTAFDDEPVWDEELGREITRQEYDNRVGAEKEVIK